MDIESTLDLYPGLMPYIESHLQRWDAMKEFEIYERLNEIREERSKN